jgi:glucose/arabinose dehydrogenase
VGDVGEITWEEIDVVERGRHYGWPWREGRHGWPQSKCGEIVPDVGACVDPVYECKHGPHGPKDGDGDCQSITAGVIVDSCRWPEAYRGRYLFADNANGRVWTVALDAARSTVIAGSRRDFARLSSGIPVSIRLGPDGDPYLALFPGGSGRIVRIEPAHPAACGQ